MRHGDFLYFYRVAVFVTERTYYFSNPFKFDILIKWIKNILLKIAYDGAGFHGWQRQPDKPTVQGHLETVLSRLFKTGILLNGTSRTDAGVHALGQQASFKADVNIPVEKLARVVNNALCGCEKGSFAISPVRIVEAEEKTSGISRSLRRQRQDVYL